MLYSILFLLIGLTILTYGADVLVRGASRLALAASISPLVIGLTIVAFGTSAPELMVSVYSSLSGQADVAIGNVVGSNIFNILFILGVSSLVTPLIVAQQLIRFDIPLMIGASVLLGGLAQDGKLTRIDGMIFIALLAGYTGWSIVVGRRENLGAIEQEYAQEFGGTARTDVASLLKQVLLVLVGLGMLVGGSKLFIEGAVAIAKGLGLSELVIGLTIVAAGTSLPEVATSVTAAVRGERDIPVGNAIGSNLFNIFCVLGFSSVVAPDGVNVSSNAIQFDIPVMVAVAIVCLPIVFTGKVISRWEGAMMLTYFSAYTVFLIWAAKNPEIQFTDGRMTLAVIVPLVITVLVLAAELQVRKRSAA